LGQEEGAAELEGNFCLVNVRRHSEASCCDFVGACSVEQ
jgi:hypothetical protein